MHSTAESSPWTAVSTDVVDPIVETLRRKHWWRREGRALRLLNKHWCVQLNQHIFEIRPHKSRVIAGRHVASLSKFPWLSSLNVARFVKNGDADMCRRVMREASQLPALTRMTLPRHAFQCPPDIFLQLTGTTSIQVTDCCFPWSQDMTKLTLLPLQELSVEKCTLADLHYILPKLPHLKTLNASVLLPNRPPFECEALNGLEMVRLRLHTCKAVLDLLTGFISPVSLRLSKATTDVLYALGHLPKLKALRLNSFAPDVFSSIALSKVLTKLTGFSLEGSQHLDKKTIGTFPQEPLKLECLVLKELEIQFLAFNAMSSLRSLTLMHCFMDSKALEHLTVLKGLEKLCVTDMGTTGNSSSLSWLFADNEHFPELKMLTLDVKQDLFTVLETSAALSKLEVLGLSGWETPYFSDFAYLHNLKNLRELGIFGIRVWGKMYGFDDLAVLTGLDALWVDTHGIYNEVDDGFLADTANDLRQSIADLHSKAPHIKITQCRLGITKFVEEHHTLPAIVSMDDD